MPCPSYLSVQLEVGCQLLFQLQWHGMWPSPDLVHWGRFCKGVGLILLSLFCMASVFLFPVSLLHPVHELFVLFWGSLGFLSTLHGTLPLINIQLISPCENVLPTQRFQWMTFWPFLYFPSNFLELCPGITKAIMMLSNLDTHKSSTVLMLAYWGLNRNVPYCLPDLSHCPVPSFCSLLFNPRQEALGILGLVLVACV